MTEAVFSSCRLMGIVNLTDNSFVVGSRLAGASDEAVVARVAEMFDSGADIIDIGASSSAPGNVPVDSDTEWRRLESPLGALMESFPDAVFSIDTFRSDIMKKVSCLSTSFKGKLIVNDISAGSMDSDLLPLVASKGFGYVAMDSSSDPFSFFTAFADTLRRQGISDWMLDPGFGFGKSVEENWKILENLEIFGNFGRPVLAGLSRKRMIYLPCGKDSSSCQNESVRAEMLAISKGASVIRTHDVSLLKSLLSQTRPHPEARPE